MTSSSPQQSRLPQRRLIAAATSFAIATATVVVPVGPLAPSTAVAQSTNRSYHAQSGVTGEKWFINIFDVANTDGVYEINFEADSFYSAGPVTGSFPPEAQYEVGLPNGVKVVAIGYGSQKPSVRDGYKTHTLRLVLEKAVTVPAGNTLQVTRKVTVDGHELIRGLRTVNGTATLLTASQIGAVSGVVRNNLGNPVSNAQVVVYNAATGRSFTKGTDANGHYTIDRLLPGSYAASVVTPPDEAYYQKAPVTFDVRAGDTTSRDISVELTRGLVSAIVNNPKLGTSVTLSGGPQPGVNRTLAQVSRTFDFADLLPGNYTVTVRPPRGYTVSPTTREINLTPQDIISGTVPKPEFTLTATEVPVSVTVKDDTGAIVPGANVVLISETGSRISTGTDSTGKATFPRIQPGPYSIEVTGKDGQHRKLTGKLTVREVNGFNSGVTLSTLNEVTGSVRDELGRGIAGAEVKVVNERFGVDLALTTSEDGTFDAGALRAGQYTVTVLADKDGRFPESQAETLTVTAGQKASANLNVVLNRGQIAVTIDGPVQPKRVYITDGPDGSTLSQGASSSPYSFTNLMPGTYTAGIEAPDGYSATPRTRQLTVQPNTEAAGAFTISADPVSASFTVLNDVDLPVADAQVELRGLDGKSAVQKTGGDGRVTFNGVAPGPYTVVVRSASTYSGNSQRVDVVPVTGAAETIRVGSLTSIRGSVVDDLGNPVTGKVTVTGDGYQQTVDVEEGSFEVSGISSGLFTAEVHPEPLKHTGATESFAVDGSIGGDALSIVVPIIRREGEVTVAGPAKSVVISGGPESISERLELMDGKARTAPLAPGSYTVAVTPQDGYEVDQHEKLLEVAIQAGTNDPARTSFTITALPANVNGLVTDLNGAPLTDRQRASVTLTAADGTTTPALVNGEGRFQIGGLKPGTYTAEVRAANHETETIPALELAPGERKPLTAKLRALDGSIAGTVVDQVGAPLAGATVELLDANGEPLAQQPTVQGGAISTVSVRPGEYTARVTPPMGYGEAVDKQVKVGAGESASLGRIAFSVQPQPVNGTILGQNGETVEGVQAWLTQEGQPNVSLQIDAGTARAQGVLPGEYQVRVNIPPDSGYLTPDPQSVRVSPGEAGSFHVVLLKNEGTVQGSVTDEFGTAVEGARVGLVDSDNNFVPGTVDGTTVNVPHVKAGTYQVFAKAPGYFREVAPQPVVVRANETANFATIRLREHDGVIQGRVVDAAGNPVPSATVEARAAGVSPVSAEVDEQGAFSAIVRPGTYTLMVTPPTGYTVKTKSQTVEVSRDATASAADFVLQKVVTPTTTTPKPTPTTPKPTPTTPTPTPTPTTTTAPPTTTPTPTTSKPAPTTAKPTPTTTTAKPTPTPTTTTAPPTTTPTPTTSKPAPTTTTTTPKPTLVPTSTTLKPTATTTTPTSTTQKPTPTTTTPTTTTPKPTPTTTTAKPTPTTTTAKPTPTSTTAKPKPKDVYSWKPVAVVPGQVALEQPKRTGNSGTKVTFSAGKVERVVPSGNTEPLSVGDTWIAVQEDGTIVATPPADTDPGTYRVEVVTSAGDKQVVTIEVAAPENMADRYTVTFPPQAAPAGTARQMGAPTADVREGGFQYRGRALPRGTRFEARGDFSQHVSVDIDGRVTFAPPLGTPAGVVNIPIEITFPDGSSKVVDAQFTVGDALLASTVDVDYEPEISVLPGQRVSVLQTNMVLPENTWFELDPSTRTGDWTVTVDKRTGAIRVSAPANGSAPLTVKVNAYFPDGSTKQIEAKVGVAPPTASAARHTLRYAPVNATRGASVTLPLEGNAPDGTAFVLVDGGGMPVAVDKHTGAVRVEVPADASLDETTDIRVRALYPDRSAEELVAKVTVVSDAVRFTPAFEGANVTAGGSVSIRPGGGLPPGTTFEVNFEAKGWKVSINKDTGELTVLSDGSVTPGQEALIPVHVTYPDGSSEIVTIPVTAVKPPQIRQTQPVEDDTTGSSVSWLPIVLGVLAALAGAGYAAFMNQDYLRDVLGQFGINI